MTKEEYNKWYKETYREQINKKAVEYRRKNRDEINRKARERSKTPEAREKNRLKMKAYREKNRDKILERNRRNRKDGYYSVYYLPNEHYVGMTDQYEHRMKQHKQVHKRDITDCRVLMTFDNPFDAHIYETQWHKMGANGFQYYTKL